MGLFKKSIEIRERFLELSKKIFGEKDKDYLNFLHNLLLSVSLFFLIINSILMIINIKNRLNLDKKYQN